MSNNILTSIKDALDVDSTSDVFDERLILYINSTFSLLAQLGVGPETGYTLTDKNDTWNLYISNNPMLLNLVKEYTICKCRIAFDPPSNSFLMEAIKSRISELEVRMNIESEGKVG